MNRSLLEKDLRGNETIKYESSRRIEEESNFRSPPHTILSLSSNNSQHNKSVLEVEDGDEKERDGNETSLKRKGKKGIKTKVCSRGHWRPTEDAKLKELVVQFGPQNWNSIAHHLPGRSGKSCRLRWYNQLDPMINKKAFTDEEELKLLAAQEAYGKKWAFISRLFPGRTDNSVKNHWHVITARQTRERQRHQTPPAPSGNAKMTVSSSGQYNDNELFGKVEKGSLVNKADGDEDDEDGSAVSTCTTELSLTPPSLVPHGFLKYDNTLPSDKERQCLQKAEVNGEDKYGKKMDHQNHHTISGSERKVEMKSGFYFFDFLGVGEPLN